jgi:hypothetical protein
MTALMEPERETTPRARGRRPTVETVMTALVGALVFLIAVRPAIDNDLWFHLRTARWMLDHHDWVGVDPFTHTRPGVVRVQTDWLSQLLLHGVWRVAGLVGLALLTAGVITGAMLVLYRTIDGSVRVRLGVVVLTAAASSIFWSARPQMFTFLGTIAVGAILRAWRRHPDHLLVWWLVPLVLVWSNVHGGVVYGVLIILGTVAGEGANRRFGRRPLDGPAMRRLGLVALACVATMVVNPSGLRVYGLPFHQVSSSSRFVQEVQPPSLTDPTALPFFLLLALTVVLMLWRRRAVDLVEVVLVAGTAAIALQFTRSVPFFAVVAAPVVARHLSALVDRPRDPSWSPSAPAPAGLVALLGVALAATMGMSALRLEPDRVEERLESEFPVAATAWIHQHQPPAELFNTFDWGGYLMWELPEMRVSVDGRTDVYDDYLATYRATIAATPGWSEELDREGIGTVLVDPGSPLATALRDTPGWQLAYEDPVAIVFVRG